MEKKSTPQDFTILLVDDEKDLLDVIAVSFERKGFNVVVASNGKEAYEVIKMQLVDLVLSDIRMPQLNGVEFLELIKKDQPKLPVVMFITGFADISTEDAIKRGASAVFSKPFNQDVIFRAVYKALNIDVS